MERMGGSWVVGGRKRLEKFINSNQQQKQIFVSLGGSIIPKKFNNVCVSQVSISASEMRMQKWPCRI